MNQPRFKFGDIVEECGLFGANTKPFPVKRMEMCDGRFRIWTPDGRLSNEDNFELFQEPQKKKLYAYISADIVIFAAFDGSGVDYNGTLFGRMPFYDIEYPENK